MRDEYLVACHLVNQSGEIYGHLSRDVSRGQDPLDERKRISVQCLAIFKFKE